MSAALAPLCACLALLAQGPELAPRFSIEPVALEVGQPMRWTLELVHPRAERPVLVDGELVLERGWVLLEGGQPRSVAVPEQPDRETTRYEWSVVCLEPQSGPVPAPALSLGGATLTAPPVELEVRGLLAEGEDEPRPARGFRSEPQDPEEEDGWLPALALVEGALVLAGLVLAAVLFLRRAPAPAPAPGFQQRLAELEPALCGESDSAREAHFDLARLVREATEARLGAAAGARTDEEWLAAVGVRLGADHGDLGSDLARLLERCTEVRYAGHTPSRWAAEETCALARGVLERLVPGEVEG